jgi:hypothetical protein
MWYKSKFKVERNSAVGKSASGQTIHELVVIIPELNGDIVPKSQEAYHPEIGETVITYDVLVCPVVDIKAKDIIMNLETGEKYKATQVRTFSLLPRTEVTLEGGIVDGRSS